MSKASVMKYCVYSFAFLMMGGLISFFPSVANNTAIFYQSIIAAFLGVDVAITLKTTNALPEGEFKKINVARYIYSGATSFVLFALSLILTKIKKYELTPSVTVFSSGVFVTLAVLIGAFEGNKLLTYGDPSLKDKPPVVPTPPPTEPTPPQNLNEEGQK